MPASRSSAPPARSAKTWRLIAIAALVSTVAGVAGARRPTTRPTQRGGVLGRTEEQIVRYTNIFRTENQLPKLVADEKLGKAAHDFAVYLAEKDQLSHSADGKSPAQRAEKAGYEWSRIGENIAYTYAGMQIDERVLARQFLKQWKDSRPHRKNMSTRDFVHIGVGVARSKKTGRFYAVQLFARPRR